MKSTKIIKTVPTFISSPLLPQSNSQQQHSTPRRTRPVQMSVARVRTPQDFAAALPARSARLAVINFVTSNCRACKYASHAFARVAAELTPGGRNADVSFFEMNVSDTELQRLGQRLGVSAVPSCQVYAYKGEGRDGSVGVLDEVVGARGASEIKEKVSKYCAEGVDLDEYDFE